MRTQRPNPPSSPPSPPPQAQIAALAYQYYVERGFSDGQDMEDWLRAEAALRSQWSRAQGSTSPGPSADSQGKIRPLDEREYPLARGKRGSASREEIRQQNPMPARM